MTYAISYRVPASRRLAITTVHAPTINDALTNFTGAYPDIHVLCIEEIVR